ncbi:hypothetical protein [Rubripirellula obstinata]|nr:hypothetical protein [Rubripirellula obstinata]
MKNPMVSLGNIAGRKLFLYQDLRQQAKPNSTIRCLSRCCQFATQTNRGQTDGIRVNAGPETTYASATGSDLDFGTLNAMEGNQRKPNHPRHAIHDKRAFMQKSIGTADKLNDETPIELQEMARAIESLPERYRDVVAPALTRVVECSTRRRRILTLVQEALSQLRLDMKYLIFDLEATRRERDEYKEQLDQLGRGE